MAEAVLTKLESTIADGRLTGERQSELHDALSQLRRELGTSELQWPPRFYIMEGATGVPPDEGRPATDPDENMAAKVIAFVSRILSEPAVVAVPDAANQMHTLKLFQSFGINAELIETENRIEQSARIYIARMDSSEQMEWAFESTSRGDECRDVIVLGPPLGHATKWINHNTRLTIMGNAKLANGHLEKSSLSTNTKDPQAEHFLVKALSYGPANCITSRSMGPNLAISLTELQLGSNLITDNDKLHWARNSKEQFWGVASFGLLRKRLVQSRAEVLFSKSENVQANTHSSPFDQPPKYTGLAFASFLDQILQSTPEVQTLSSVTQRLGPGYGFLTQDSAGTQTQQYLHEIIESHKIDPKFQDFPDTEEAHQLVDLLSDSQKIHAFAALSLAFQNIYEEKTLDGWTHSEPGFQWRAQVFDETYLSHPGKQVPYDAAVVLQQITGMWKTEADKVMTANKLLLALWSDLST